MKEKTKIKVHRLVWLSLFLFSLIIPLIVNMSLPELSLVDCTVSRVNYYSALDETAVEIELEFNRKVSSGYVTITYYDDSDNVLDTKTDYLISYGKTAYDSYVIIDGNVNSYEIVSYDFNTVRWFPSWILIISINLFIWFIGTMLLSYKEYTYDGKIISVYSGWYHHTLRINGILCDEHNTIAFFTPILLSTNIDDNTIVGATISLTNRITLKVNNRLVR